MLTETQLLDQISSTIGKLKVLELSKILKQGQFALNNLVDITFYEDEAVAFRAAWLLENLFLANPESYADGLGYVIGRFLSVTYPSCQRHYAKIIMHVTSSKAPEVIKSQIACMDMEKVIEKLFEWMAGPEIKIAVKVFSGEALFNLRHRQPWIGEELALQLQFLMRNGTAAIQSRGKKILAKLEA